MLLVLGLAFVGLMYMNSRGRKKQQQAREEFIDTLSIGDEVMTKGGQLGTVVEFQTGAVVLETTPGVLTRWLNAAVDPIPPQFRAELDADDEEFDDDAEDVEVIEEGESDESFADFDASKHVTDPSTDEDGRSERS